MADSGITIHADEFIRRLVATKRPALDKPVALGLADTARTAKFRASLLIARQINVPAAAARSRIYYDFVRVGQYSVTIKSSRRPFGLHQIRGTTQVAAGVRTRAWGKGQVLKSAFMVHGKAFRRRSGAGRFPIRFLYGPSIWGTFKHKSVQSLIANVMRERLKGALLRRIAAAQRRGA
jgi:hypothetical protein